MRLFLATAFLASSIPTCVWAQAPSVGTVVLEINYAMEECVSRAQAAVRSLGANPQVFSEAQVYGIVRNVTFAIRCQPRHKIVFFAAAGCASQCPDYLRSLMSAFSK